jgi:hypothetical protein
MSSLDERKANTEDFIQKQKAYYTGIANAPLDALKLFTQAGGALLDNSELARLVGRNPDNRVQRQEQINEFYKNPPFLPQAVNDHRTAIVEQNPEMSSVGNIVAGSFTGSALYKKIMQDALSKASQNTVRNGYAFNPSASGAVSSTVNETIAAPFFNTR